MARGSGALKFAPGGAWQRLDSETVGGAAGAPTFCYTGTLQLGLRGALWCRGREALAPSGSGGMVWRLWGALTLARRQGSELDTSALLRWLAEGVCFPPALRPSPQLRWLPCTEGDPARSARAVVTSACGATAAAIVTWDAEGRFVELRSDDYWRVLPDGSVAQHPWRARGSGHQRFA